jgi:glycosyltransferase involved in cell wall biosynthesis
MKSKIPYSRIIKIFLFSLLALFILSIFNTPILNTGNVNIQPVSPICSDTIFDGLIGQNNVFFTWLTDESTWTDKQWLSVESFLIHHSDMSVTVIAPELPIYFFSHLRAAGYSVQVLKVTPEILLENCAYVGPNTRTWLSKSPEYKKAPFFYSHFSDYLRFWLLYKFGGLYMDLDAITLQELPLQTEFIGKDCVDFNDDNSCKPCSYKIDWCIDEMYYLAPGVMHMFPGHQFLVDLMEVTFTKNYKPKCWKCVGPRAITTEWKKSKPSFLTILDSFLLYPYNYKNSKSVFFRSNSSMIETNILQRRSYSLHLFGKISSKIGVEEGSVLSILIKRLRLSCRSTAISVYHPNQMILSNEVDSKLLNIVILRVPTLLTHSNTRIKICLAGVVGTFKFLHSETSCQEFESYRQANEHLKTIEYFGTSCNDRLSIRIQVNDEEIVVPPIETILWESSVTFITKTVSRQRHVKRLLSSLRKFYPNTPTIISNDGATNLSISVDKRSRSLRIFQFEQDVGLSFARNYMISAASTPYVFLVDDDFYFHDISLDILMLALINDRADIAGIRILNDEDPKSLLDFSGMIDIIDSKNGPYYNFRKGEYPRTFGDQCSHKDMIPNIFLAKRESLISVKWDRNLKLGEHEDFFLRAVKQNLKVINCPFISVHHNQDRWRLKTFDQYAMKRQRAYYFLQKMLRKHSLVALRSMGTWVVSQNCTYEKWDKLSVSCRNFFASFA